MTGDVSTSESSQDQAVFSRFLHRPWPMVLSVLDAQRVDLTGWTGLTIQSVPGAGDYRVRYWKAGRYVLAYVDLIRGWLGPAGPEQHREDSR